MCKPLFILSPENDKSTDMSRVFRNIKVLRSLYGQQVIIGAIGNLPSVQVKPCPGTNRIIAAVIRSPVHNSTCRVDNNKLITCKLQPLNVEVVIYAIIGWRYPLGYGKIRHCKCHSHLRRYACTVCDGEDKSVVAELQLPYLGDLFKGG